MLRPNLRLSGRLLGTVLLAMGCTLVMAGVVVAQSSAAGVTKATTPEPLGQDKPKRPAVGEKLPQLEAIDAQGNPWKSAERAGKGTLVIYFYPGDFTGGCIKQAQQFQVLVQKFRDAGAEVVGVSGDEVATHHLFQETFQLPQTLLADPEGKFASALGVPVAVGGKVRTRDSAGKPVLDEHGKSIILNRPVTIARWTYLVGKDGKILAIRENVDPVKDAAEVLALLGANK